MREMEKLQILLRHWMEHNAAHEEEFERWAQSARAAGLEEVAGRISAAANRLQEATGCLRQALAQLDSGGGRDVPE